MTFNSYSAILFMALVLLIFHFLKHHRHQNLFLVAASFFFYVVGEPIFVTLLLSCIAISFYGSHAIQRNSKYRKPVLVSCIVLLLVILGIFKYFDFFVDSFFIFFDSIGLPFQKLSLQIGLPIAISFYTFQSIGYLVDVYRGDTEAEESLVDYALFVSFFPQLVAGPIERSTNLLKQIKTTRQVKQNDVTYGTYLILQGFFKKVVIADNLAPIVDGVLQNPTLSGPIIFVAMLGFAFQIYCDFSGYTDIARGISRLMGFKLVLNFNQPYASRSLTEFWRRWHISLSNWFRDYVYISLGGSRTTTPKMYFNLLVTMTVSGLWHGASANFVLWGFYHGIFLIAHKLWEDNLKVHLNLAVTNSAPYSFLAWCLTFIATLYGWLLFRIEDFSQITRYTGQLFSDWQYTEVAALLFSQIGVFVALSLLIDIAERKYLDIRNSEMKTTILLPLYWAAVLVLIVLLGVEGSGDFIYFRF